MKKWDIKKVLAEAKRLESNRAHGVKAAIEYLERELEASVNAGNFSENARQLRECLEHPEIGLELADFQEGLRYEIWSLKRFARQALNIPFEHREVETAVAVAKTKREERIEKKNQHLIKSYDEIKDDDIFDLNRLVLALERSDDTFKNWATNGRKDGKGGRITLKVISLIPFRVMGKELKDFLKKICFFSQ